MEVVNCGKLKNDLAILKKVKKQFDDILLRGVAIGNFNVDFIHLLQQDISKQTSWLRESLRVAKMSEIERLEYQLAQAELENQELISKMKKF